MLDSIRRATALVLVSLGVGACGSATGGAAPSVESTWLGTWTLASVNGQALPADITAQGSSKRIVRRTLMLSSNGNGSWSDSTLSASTCPSPSTPTALCNDSGKGQFAWSASGGKGDGTGAGATLIVLPNLETVVGYFVAAKTFVLQADGTLLKTDEGATEVYRRQ